MEISLEIPLPFKIPVVNELKFVSGYPWAKFFIRFEMYERSTFFYEEYEKDEKYSKLYVRYFPEASYVTTPDTNELLRLAVLDSLWYINRLIDASRNCFGLEYLYNITIWDLPSILLIQIEDKKHLYVNNREKIPGENFMINSQGLQLIGRTVATWDQYPELYMVEKFFDQAKSNLYKEQFIEAVINLQTSFEIFIRNTMSLIYKQMGLSEEVITKRSGKPFRNTIEHQLAKLLKTDLNFHTTPEINKWYKKVYVVRNEIVHQGRYVIDSFEANEAYESYIEARNYISNKLVENNYLSEDGTINLSLIRKKTPIPDDSTEFIKYLKSRGLIDSHLEIAQNPKNTSEQ